MTVSVVHGLSCAAWLAGQHTPSKMCSWAWWPTVCAQRRQTLLPPINWASEESWMCARLQLIRHMPWKLKAAQAAKEKQYSGIPVQDPMSSDSPEQMVPLIHCLCGPIGDQAAQLMLTIIPHVCNGLFNKGHGTWGRSMWKARQTCCHMLVHVHLSSMHAVYATALGNAQDRRWPAMSLCSGGGGPPQSQPSLT